MDSLGNAGNSLCKWLKLTDGQSVGNPIIAKQYFKKKKYEILVGKHFYTKNMKIKNERGKKLHVLA